MPVDAVTAALEAMNGAVVVTDPRGVILWVNRAFSELTGYALDDVRGRTPRVLKSGAHDGEFYSRLWQAILTGGSWRGELHNRRKDGTLYWEEQAITGVRGENGIAYFVGVKQDITERKRAEEALRESEERWQFALEGAGDGVWDWDADSGLFYSRQWKAMLGYEEDEIENTGEAWLGRLHPADRERVLATVRLQEEGKTLVYNCEYRLRCKDGTYKWVLARGKIVRWAENGKARRIIGIHTDISQRKAVEIELARLNRLYAALSRVNEAIVRVPTREELFEQVVRALGEAGGFAMVSIGWHDPATQVVTPVAHYGHDAGYLRAARILADDGPEGNGPTGTAIREGRPYVCNDFLDDPRTLPWREPAAMAGWRASAAFPIRLGGES